MEKSTLEHIVKWDWKCLPSWECTGERLGGVVGWILGGVLGSVLRAYFRVYSQAGWECIIEWNWKFTWERAWKCDWESLDSAPWERIVKQAGSVPSSVIGSILKSMPRSELGNVLGGVLGSVLGVHLGPSWECKSSRLGVYSRMQSGVYFRAYLWACKEVYSAVWFQVCWMQHDV